MCLLGSHKRQGLLRGGKEPGKRGGKGGEIVSFRDQNLSLGLEKHQSDKTKRAKKKRRWGERVGQSGANSSTSNAKDQKNRQKKRLQPSRRPGGS